MMTISLLRRLARRSPLALLAALPLAGCMSMASYGEAPGYDRGYPDYPREAAGWYGRDVASVDYFYGSLGRHGRWDTHPGYGRVFVPGGVGLSWRPYSQGYWADDPRFGRRWVSSEPFGWATYHYGRWARDPRLGWFWVPDTRFGPGWVNWREGSGYSGWAPLPPRGWERWGVGYNPWGWDSWLFAPSSYLYRPGLYSHIVRGRPHYDRTRPVNRPDRPDGWTGNRPGGRPDWRDRDDDRGRDDGSDRAESDRLGTEPADVQFRRDRWQQGMGNQDVVRQPRPGFQLDGSAPPQRGPERRQQARAEAAAPPAASAPEAAPRLAAPREDVAVQAPPMRQREQQAPPERQQQWKPRDAVERMQPE